MNMQKLPSQELIQLSYGLQPFGFLEENYFQRNSDELEEKKLEISGCHRKAL